MSRNIRSLCDGNGCTGCLGVYLTSELLNGRLAIDRKDCSSNGFRIQEAFFNSGSSIYKLAVFFIGRADSALVVHNQFGIHNKLRVSGYRKLCTGHQLKVLTNCVCSTVELNIVEIGEREPAFCGGKIKTQLNTVYFSQRYMHSHRIGFSSTVNIHSGYISVGVIFCFQVGSCAQFDNGALANTRHAHDIDGIIGVILFHYTCVQGCPSNNRSTVLYPNLGRYVHQRKFIEGIYGIDRSIAPLGFICARHVLTVDVIHDYKGLI